MRRDLFAALGAVVLVLAATVSFDRVFVDGGWVPLAWGAVALSLLIAATFRAIRFGAIASAVASSAVWIVFVYVTQLDADGLLPGSAQLREFIDLWEAGFDAILREPTPARPLPGLLLIVSTGCWWLTHVTHELLARLHRPGAAIVAAATLWIFPLAPPQPPGRTWTHALPFLVAAGLVLLLEPSPDLEDSHAASRNGREPPRALAAGGVVGGIALVLTLVFPGVVPGYGSEALVDLSGPDPARGYQPIVDVSQRLKLPQPRDLLHVQAERPLYLRLAGLETFDGRVWRLGPQGSTSFAPEEVIPAGTNLPPETRISHATRLDAQVENLSLENVFVPVPYHPIRVTGEAADRMVYSQEGTFVASSDLLGDEPALVPGLSYGVVAAQPNPAPADLQSVGPEVFDDPAYRRWTELPADYPNLRELADEVLADASTPYDVAFTLQDFFRGGDRFTYSVDVDPLRGDDALARFVLEDRVGYCEYFATAMAVMLRLEGIPARVAVGFRTGEEVLPGEYVVTTDDAHAWVEVLFPGYGWIQFEPTPALGDAIVPTRDNIAPDRPIAQQEAEEQPTTAPSPLATAQPGPEQELPDETGGLRGQETQTGSTGSRWPLQGLAVLLLAATVAAIAVAAGRRQLHEGLPAGDTGKILLAQRRLFDHARSLEVGRRPHETTLELVDRWVREGRVDAATARRFADIAQRAAFEGHLSAGEGQEAERLAGRLMHELDASVEARTRLLAPVRGPANHVVDSGRRIATAVKERMTAPPRR